jgi:FAD/FMN-containing dehydrogenase
MKKNIALTLALAVGTATAALAQQSSARAQVLALGVYHMANRGHDIYNLRADDVLAPKRQAEIAQLIEILKRFNPTKIAVEADLFSPTNPTTNQRPNEYADYVAGKHELSRDEVEQIGFRLAKELGHKTIYPVNADYDFPYQRLVDYAKANGRSKELDEIMGGFSMQVKAQGEYLASHTILEMLLYMNTDEKTAEDVGLYYRLAHFGEPGDWAGADLLADWFPRNIRIYSNVMGLVDSPSERILIIYGHGHLAWLRHNFGSDPTVELRKLSDFAK